MAKDPNEIEYSEEQLAEHASREKKAAKINKKLPDPREETPEPEQESETAPPPPETTAAEKRGSRRNRR